jgi:uncharacterized protein YcbK (DUF882 family)
MHEDDLPEGVCPCCVSRRAALFGLIGVGAVAALPAAARAAVEPRRPDKRLLNIQHAYHGDKLRVPYHANGRYEVEAVSALDKLFRDTFDDTVSAMDTRLFDLLWDLQRVVGGSQPIVVYSGFRSPETNEKLRAKSRAVAKESYHMRGMAADIAIPGMDLRALALKAISLKQGGVGFYSRKSKFIHVDVGPVRKWNI